MKSLPAARWTCVALGLAAAVASAARPQVTVTRWAPIDSSRGFSSWHAELRHLVDTDQRFPLNHFCVVVATGTTAPPAGSYTWAYVHWREAARLYTFGQSDEPMSDLTMFKAPLDLHKDVVASERQIAGSTYRVTRARMAHVLQHCARAGTSVVVKHAR